MGYDINEFGEIVIPKGTATNKNIHTKTCPICRTQNPNRAYSCRICGYKFKKQISGWMIGLFIIGAFILLSILLLLLIGWLFFYYESNSQSYMNNHNTNASYGNEEYYHGGTGDLKIMLQWDFYADIDLHVVEPSGEEIYFEHSTSRTGGKLDIDNYAGGPGSLENIFWENPPHGLYTVTLVYYAQKDGYPVSQQQGTCSVTILQKNQEPQYYTIQLSPDDYGQAIMVANIIVT